MRSRCLPAGRLDRTGYCLGLQGWAHTERQQSGLPFYHGEMRIKGKLYPHSYPALISKELFDQCEKVRVSASRASATRYSEKPFVFRGLIKCATSGRVVTSDIKKDRHTYLICRDPTDLAMLGHPPTWRLATLSALKSN